MKTSTFTSKSVTSSSTQQHVSSSTSSSSHTTTKFSYPTTVTNGCSPPTEESQKSPETHTTVQHHKFSSSTKNTQQTVTKTPVDGVDGGPTLYRVRRFETSSKQEDSILQERIRRAEEKYSAARQENPVWDTFQFPSFQSLFADGGKDLLNFRRAPVLSGKELTSFLGRLREHGRTSYEKEEHHESANASRHARTTANAEIDDDERRAAVRTNQTERQTRTNKTDHGEEYAERNFQRRMERTCYRSDGLKDCEAVVGNMMTAPMGQWASSDPRNVQPDKVKTDPPFSEPKDVEKEIHRPKPSKPAPTRSPVPSNVSEKATPEPEPAPPAKAEPPAAHKSGSHQRILWSHLPEVCSSGLLKSMSKKQIVIKEREYEIFTTQITYCATLGVLVEHFYNDLRFMPNNTTGGDAAVIDNYQKLNIFLNCLALHTASERLLQQLVARWQSQTPMFVEVCDLIRDHFMQEPGYKYYIRNMPSQAHMLQALSANESFQRVLTELESHERCCKLPLLSFLAAPFKRVTQLRLMLENLLKEMQRESKYATAPDATVLQHVEEAYNVLSNLLYDVEREKKFLDDNECRIILSNSLVYYPNYKTLDLSSQSLERQDAFQVLKPRTLNPWQRRDVVLILLSNILIVTRMKRDRKLRVLDHCPREKATIRPLRLYSSPSSSGNTNSSFRNSWRKKAPRKSASMPESTTTNPGNLKEMQEMNCGVRDTLLSDETLSLNSQTGSMCSAFSSATAAAARTKSMRPSTTCNQEECQLRLVISENHFGLRREFTLQATHPGIVMCWSALLSSPLGIPTESGNSLP